MKSEQIVSWLRDKAARAEGRDYRKMLTVAAEKIVELETELREEIHRHDRLQDFEVAEAEELRKAREGNRWIPVTERLPEEEGEYITYTDRGQIHIDCFCIYPKHETQFWIGGNGNVTYWMPLPEPTGEG